MFKQYYTLVIYTASHQSYTDAVLELIEPRKEFFEYRLYRNNCIPTKIDGKDFFIKDLREANRESIQLENFVAQEKEGFSGSTSEEDDDIEFKENKTNELNKSNNDDVNDFFNKKHRSTKTQFRTELKRVFSGFRKGFREGSQRI